MAPICRRGSRTPRFLAVIRGGRQIASGDTNELLNDHVGRTKGRVEIGIRTERAPRPEFVAGSISEQAALADIVAWHGESVPLGKKFNAFRCGLCLGTFIEVTSSEVLIRRYHSVT